jgi:acyl-CoA synthetase (AMP-forming)/AMP-acid ligase II
LDTYGYIFTSGTTGLPKAAIIAHLKLLTAMSFASMAEAKPGVDVLYTCLPLFHSAAGVIGCSFLLNGCTMIIRRKFSARTFFEDCTKYNATIVQYIGELCRYLLASAPSKWDKAHKVRVAIGNGLRPEIWKEFQERFNIPEVLEFYGVSGAIYFGVAELSRLTVCAN